MIWSMIRYIKGYLLIRVEGYSPERFLNACSHRGIELWGLRSAGGAYEMYMTLKDFRKIKALSKKTGTKVRVRRRYGLPFFLHRYRRRKLFFAGAFLAVCLVYILTLFIWEIDIRGNLRRTDEALLSFLRSRDVYCGMTAGSVDCDQIADDLRGAYADLVWVSASVHGTRLVIQVKENEHLSAQTGGKAQETEGTDLAATQDCTILSIVTRQGTPLVHEGDQVKKGDLLVNGRLDLKNDAGEVTGYRYCKAQADITGEYQISYEDTMEREFEIRSYQYERNNLVRQEELFLRAGDRIFSFGRLKNNYQEYDYYVEESQLTVGENFSLPLFWGRRTAVPCSVRRENYTDSQLQQLLSRRFEKACQDIEKKGLEIIENDVKIYTEQNAACARGTLTVRGPVAGEVPTQILPEPQVKDQTEREDQTNGNE
ncbi:MAG TPA: sporulation protein YqfD [Lachnoclostridium phocaeense]|uniref:Sporulation protein YqfD n=1 Tax=Lachnoclostridium phocaeense TaxID=1871021 RepID=A0A921LE63_9FIRM|nr:sporulation protein YqfD [Lachnoclostridium phocaeense]